MEMIKTLREYHIILARATHDGIPSFQRAQDYQSLGRTIEAMRELIKADNELITAEKDHAIYKGNDVNLQTRIDIRVNAAIDRRKKAHGALPGWLMDD